MKRGREALLVGVLAVLAVYLVLTAAWEASTHVPASGAGGPPASPYQEPVFLEGDAATNVRVTLPTEDSTEVRRQRTEVESLKDDQGAAAARLAGLVTLEVAVLGELDADYANVELLLENDAGVRIHETRRTDERGHLSIDLPPGELRLSAWTAKAIAGPAHAVITEPSASIDLHLVPARIVRVRVVDSVLRTPVKGARLWVPVLSELRPVTTQDDGHGELHLPADGSVYFIHCEARHYGPERFSLGIAPDGKWRLERGSPGGDPTRTSTQSLEPAVVDVELMPQRVITGRVLGPDGQPLEGAHAFAEGHYWSGDGVASPNTAKAETTPEGDFLLRQLRPDITHVVTLRHEGHCGASVKVPPADEPALDLGDIILGSPASLEGELVDPQGLPAAGLQVRLQRPIPPAQGLERPRHGKFIRDLDVRSMSVREARTNRRGRFSFEGVEPGEHTLVVKSDTKDVLTQKVELLAGLDPWTALMLPQDVLSIEGVVLGPEGPVAGAVVELELLDKRSTTTGSDGGFRFAGLTQIESPYELSARWSGDDGRWISKPQQTHAGGGSVSLQLVRQGSENPARVR